VTLLVLLAFGTASDPTASAGGRQVRIWRVAYRAHNGLARDAYIVLPSWYGPENNPPIPLVISPHGRGVTALANAWLFGALPARGPFAVISPAGQGRKLELESWGSLGQISDLARMPQIAELTLPWLHVDHSRVYAIGGSMGGQETLLLLARHPRLLAGAAALDSVTNLALQYRRFARIPCNKACRRQNHGSVGHRLRALAREEIGGGPIARARAFAERSPITYARAIASSCVPLELWWSVKDRIVTSQKQQSAALYDAITTLNPAAPLQGFVGFWNHSAEMHADTRLPEVLAELGLLPPVKSPTEGLHLLEPPDEGIGCDASSGG
jgi:pimeloyl-ACP methyl ester carboxylesterase